MKRQNRQFHLAPARFNMTDIKHERVGWNVGDAPSFARDRAKVAKLNKHCPRASVRPDGNSWCDSSRIGRRGKSARSQRSLGGDPDGLQVAGNGHHPLRMDRGRRTVASMIAHGISSPRRGLSTVWAGSEPRAHAPHRPRSGSCCRRGGLIRSHRIFRYRYGWCPRGGQSRPLLRA